jgi:D-glycero-D-manno-heptose 1,7-bisphosphate phosphatase
MGEHRRFGGTQINRAVFLDRDGVINRVVLRQGKPYPPASLDDLELLPGVDSAVTALRDAGFRIIVVTNQPDVATGLQQRQVVESMHSQIRGSLNVDDIRVCYHIDDDGCLCRKPKPGMLLDAAADWALELDQCFMVGDRWRDVDAGRAAGCRTILIRSDYAENQPESPDAIADSLLEASSLILSGRIGDRNI